MMGLTKGDDRLASKSNCYKSETINPYTRYSIILVDVLAFDHISSFNVFANNSMLLTGYYSRM